MALCLYVSFVFSSLYLFCLFSVCVCRSLSLFVSLSWSLFIISMSLCLFVLESFCRCVSLYLSISLSLYLVISLFRHLFLSMYLCFLSFFVSMSLCLFNPSVRFHFVSMSLCLFASVFLCLYVYYACVSRYRYVAVCLFVSYASMSRCLSIACIFFISLSIIVVAFFRCIVVVATSLCLVASLPLGCRQSKGRRQRAWHTHACGEGRWTFELRRTDIKHLQTAQTLDLLVVSNPNPNPNPNLSLNPNHSLTLTFNLTPALIRWYGSASQIQT